jgi:hypothetical protein
MINPPQVLPEEPTAVTPHGGFCGGKSQQWLRYPTDLHYSPVGKLGDNFVDNSAEARFKVA